MNLNKVAFGKTNNLYNTVAPFHPDSKFPELPFDEISDEKNEPYALIRNLFFLNGFDIENYNTPNWNPLKHLVSPETTVVIKPNFVLSINQGGYSLDGVVTHPSIIRAAIDYCFIALKGRGKLIVADAPQMDCNWNELMAYQSIHSIAEFYKRTFNFTIEIIDLRNFELIDYTLTAAHSNRRKLQGDPNGSVVINLGKHSEFFGIENENYYGADFDESKTKKHHHGEIQEYCVSKTILEADTFISIPKLKVHKKVGVTLNMKGLVGINTDKNYLIHYRTGSTKIGGDQYPSNTNIKDKFLIEVKHYILNKTLSKQSSVKYLFFKIAQYPYRKIFIKILNISSETKLYDSGNWHGNDSAWRMTIDLFKIIHYCDKNGIIQKNIQRKFLSIIDGIVGGENNGPLAPTPKESKCIIIGENLLATDAVATRLMGFDLTKIKQFEAFKKPNNFDFGLSSTDDIKILTAIPEYENCFKSDSTFLNFAPHPGWKNYM